MQDEVNSTPTPHKRVPWNKGKLTGAKPSRRSFELSSLVPRWFNACDIAFPVQL